MCKRLESLSLNPLSLIVGCVWLRRSILYTNTVFNSPFSLWKKYWILLIGSGELGGLVAIVTRQYLLAAMIMFYLYYLLYVLFIIVYYLFFHNWNVRQFSFQILFSHIVSHRLNYYLISCSLFLLKSIIVTRIWYTKKIQ